MSRRRLLTLVAVITLAVVGTLILLVVTHTKHLFTPRPIIPPPGAVVIVPVIYYGFLSCNNHFIIIPGNSMVVLRYHVHGNATINFVDMHMAFPASMVNEVLTTFSKLSNQDDALIMGVYVNGRLIASNNYPEPIIGLEYVVSHSNSFTSGFIDTSYIGDVVNFPTINLTNGDVITVLIYSAVPYALPSCTVTNEGEEAELMVREHWIGLMGVHSATNATPTAEQLYEEGRYITEEPTIYIINVTSPISLLPQELSPSLLANAKPLTTGYAPSFGIGQALLPTVGNSS